MSDLISREAAIELLRNEYHGMISDDSMKIYQIINFINELPPAKQWIPIKTRPLTDDEKEEHPEWPFAVEGEIPEEGQLILVTGGYRGRKAVMIDEWRYEEDGFYLESGYDIGTEVTAWMPLPEPYKAEGENDGSNDKR